MPETSDNTNNTQKQSEESLKSQISENILGEASESRQELELLRETLVSLFNEFRAYNSKSSKLLSDISKEAAKTNSNSVKANTRNILANNANNAFASYLKTIGPAGNFGKAADSLLRFLSGTNSNLVKALNNPLAQYRIATSARSSNQEKADARANLAFYNLTKSKGTLSGLVNSARAGSSFAASRGISSLIGGAGGLVGGGILALLLGALNQLITAVKEHKEAFLGGNFVNSRRAEAQIGNYRLFSPHGINSSGYNVYRMEMRKMGVRDDEKIAQALREMTSAGIYGRDGVDAYRAAWGRQAIISNFGIDLGKEMIANLYRGTSAQSNRESFMRSENGIFTLDKFMRSIADISKGSSNGYGGFASVSEMTSLVSALTDNMLGLNNNIELAVAATKKWATTISSKEATVKEISDLYSNAGALPFNTRLSVLALSGKGYTDLLTESRKMIERGRSPEGRVQNLQVQARTALSTFSRFFGENTAQNREKFANTVLPALGLSNLANHPNMMRILEKAASGDSGAIKELQKATEGEREILQKQASTLDLIKEPITHIRDVVVGQATQGITSLMSSSRKKVAEMEAYNMGLRGEQIDQYTTNVIKVREEESKTDSSSALSTLLNAYAENMQEVPAAVEKAIEELKAINSNLTKANNQNVVIAGGSY